MGVPLIVLALLVWLGVIPLDCRGAAEMSKGLLTRGAQYLKPET